MVIEDLSTREKVINALSVTEGKALETVTHINNVQQMDLFVEEQALTWLGLTYPKERAEKYMRLAECWQGSSRKDLVSIGCTPEYKQGRSGIEDF